MAFETNVTPRQYCLAKFIFGVGKDNQTRKLGQRFRDQDPRNYRGIGKMSFEEILITPDVPASLTAGAVLDLKNFREEQERWLMRKLFDQLISPQHSHL